MRDIGFVKVGGILVPSKLRRDTCFSAGTLVRTQHGLKAIADLSGTDQVICSIGGTDASAEIQTVTITHAKDGFEALVMETANEDIIVTPDHAVVMADGSFQFARSLIDVRDAQARTLNGATALRVKRAATIDAIYNVVIATPEPDACYSVGTSGVLVSDRL